MGLGCLYAGCWHRPSKWDREWQMGRNHEESCCHSGTFRRPHSSPLHRVRQPGFDDRMITRPHVDETPRWITTMATEHTANRFRRTFGRSKLTSDVDPRGSFPPTTYRGFFMPTNFIG